MHCALCTGLEAGLDAGLLVSLSACPSPVHSQQAGGVGVGGQSRGPSGFGNPQAGVWGGGMTTTARKLSLLETHFGAVLCSCITKKKSCSGFHSPPHRGMSSRSSV